MQELVLATGKRLRTVCNIMLFKTVIKDITHYRH